NQFLPPVLSLKTSFASPLPEAFPFCNAHLYCIWHSCDCPALAREKLRQHTHSGIESRVFPLLLAEFCLF
ncbi:MAG: hypothetical protein LBR88_08100, partial [Zoogloeaceae bacterium]|nr:hypothetical protein [Zoogloeaceae bacterium]